MSNAYAKSARLIQDAQILIRPNEFNNDGGISSIDTKSQTELANNKKGFDKFIQASKLNIHWQSHFNLAEFYYSGLDGATNKNMFKCVYHYIEAWKLTNNSMTKQTSSCIEFEQLLFNICGVLEKIDLSDKQYIDTDEIMKLSKRLHKHSKHGTFKVFGHYIHGLILNRLSKRAKSYIQYKKCVEQKTLNLNMTYFANYAIIKAEEWLNTMDITNKGLNEQKKNDQQFVINDNQYQYAKNFEHFQKKRKKLNANHTDKVKSMSDINNDKINKVVITRTMDKNNQNSLITMDESLNTVSVDSGNSAERKCVFCGKLGLNMKRCSRCKKTHYCNVECQKSHWKQHKKNCKK